MKALLPLAILFICSPVTFAADNKYLLSSKSYSKPIRSCYRWLDESEMKIWKKGHTYLTRSSSTHGRNRSTGHTAFCWSNSVGSIKGHPKGATYGSYLIRIDLVDDVVMYDRNTNTYSRADDGGEIPAAMKKGIFTELVYSNYKWKADESYNVHEYYIASDKAIKSWSLADSELKRQYSYDYHQVAKGQFRSEDFLYFINAKDNGKSFSTVLRRTYTAQKAFWDKSKKDYSFDNPKKRAPLP